MSDLTPTEPAVPPRARPSTGQWAVEKVAEVVAGGDAADNERLKLFLRAAGVVFGLLALLNLAQLGIIIALLGGALEGSVGGNKVKVQGAPASDNATEDTERGDGALHETKRETPHG